MIVEKLNEEYSIQAASEALVPMSPRPSGLGGCMRELAYRLAGMPGEPRTPESMRLLELGTQRGEELERRCKTIWPDAETQVQVRIPVPWGSMEGTVDLWIPSLRTIVDFKTAGAYSMGLIIAGEKEEEGYALQLNAYRHGIYARQQQRFDAGEIPTTVPMPWGIGTFLVYEAKDSDARKGVTAGMLHEVEIPYTAALENAYQARLQEIWTLLQAQRSGSLTIESAGLIAGMPKENGKPHWKCRLSKENRPLYCSVGAIRGKCQ